MKLGLASIVCAMVAFAGLTGCGEETEPPDRAATSEGARQGSTDEIDYASALRHDLPLVDRVATYTSTGELRADSAAVVIGVPTGVIKEAPLSGDGVPLGLAEVKVTKGLYDTDIQPGTVIEVLVEGDLVDGAVVSDKMVKDTDYVLFLSRYNAPPSAYAVTGYVAGMFEQVAPDAFGRVDPESPKLPIGLDVSPGGQVTEVPATDS